MRHWISDNGRPRDDNANKNPTIPTSIPPHTMATKRTATMLQKTINSTAPRCLRANPSIYPLHTRAFPVLRHSRPAQRITISRAPVRFSSSSSKKVEKTGLYDLHAKYGAKFVPFGGYSMPVQYSDLSITESHHWTRDKASLFDVGHM